MAPNIRRGVTLVAVLALGAPARADEGWTREGATLKRGKDIRLSLAGYIQEDFRSFRDWEAGDEDTGVLRSDPHQLRRLRIGFEAELGPVSLELDVDPRPDTENLKDAYAELKLAKALRLRAGHFKVPVSAEWLTSASRIDFVERALLASHIAPGRDWGAMIHGDAADWLYYQAGVFKGDGSDRFGRAAPTGAARLVLRAGDPFALGASFTQGEVEAEVQQPGLEVEPKGTSGEGPSGFEFYESHFVNGTRRRLGFDLTVSAGPTSLKGEWLRGQDERLGQGSTLDDLPDQVATGWAVSATWLLTGEPKGGRVRPRRPLFRGPGAIELAARYEELHFDDDGPGDGFAGAGSRARNIRPSADRVVTGGLSWWPRSWLRLIGDVVVERFSDPLTAPEVGRSGDYVTLLGRVQFQVP